jgi:hypothetical protein
LLLGLRQDGPLHLLLRARPYRTGHTNTRTNSEINAVGWQPTRGGCAEGNKSGKQTDRQTSTDGTSALK